MWKDFSHIRCKKKLNYFLDFLLLPPVALFDGWTDSNALTALRASLLALMFALAAFCV